MDMVLTGRRIGAAEAERIGLVSRVVADDQVVAEATTVAELIASKSKPSAQMAKEAVGAAFESTLQQGLMFERRAIFSQLFATEDQAEGMSAFTQKRKTRCGATGELSLITARPIRLTARGSPQRLGGSRPGCG